MTDRVNITTPNLVRLVRFRYPHFTWTWIAVQSGVDRSNLRRYMAGMGCLGPGKRRNLRRWCLRLVPQSPPAERDG